MVAFFSYLDMLFFLSFGLVYGRVQTAYKEPAWIFTWILEWTECTVFPVISFTFASLNSGDVSWLGLISSDVSA